MLFYRIINELIFYITNAIKLYAILHTNAHYVNKDDAILCRFMWNWPKMVCPIVAFAEEKKIKTILIAHKVSTKLIPTTKRFPPLFNDAVSHWVFVFCQLYRTEWRMLYSVHTTRYYVSHYYCWFFVSFAYVLCRTTSLSCCALILQNGIRLRLAFHLCRRRSFQL